MRQYYFTVSTLPLLMYESEIGINSTDFLKFCEEQLTPQDFNLLKKARLDQFTETDSAVLNTWIKREIALRNELVKQRAQKLGFNAEDNLKEGLYYPGLFEIARDAVNNQSPLAGEYLLDEARWLYLDELESGHYFDIEKLIIFYLRLQMLERKALFTQQNGLAGFEEIYEKISEDIQSVYTGNE